MLKQSPKLEYRSRQEAINLRKQADGLPVSVRRDDLLRKAMEIDAVASTDSSRVLLPERVCEICQQPLTFVSKLARIGLGPKNTIFRCDRCRRIEIEIENE